MSTNITTTMTTVTTTFSPSTAVGTGINNNSVGSVTWAPTPPKPLQQQDSEIDRIMAKIEQACYFTFSYSIQIFCALSKNI